MSHVHEGEWCAACVEHGRPDIARLAEALRAVFGERPPWWQVDGTPDDRYRAWRRIASDVRAVLADPQSPEPVAE